MTTCFNRKRFEIILTLAYLHELITDWYWYCIPWFKVENINFVTHNNVRFFIMLMTQFQQCKKLKTSFIFILCCHSGIPVLSYMQIKLHMQTNYIIFNNLKPHNIVRNTDLPVQRLCFSVISSWDHTKFQIVPIHTNDRK